LLSIASPQALAAAIITGDEKLITRASGVGPKAAKRIILELKDKIGVASTWEAQQQGATTQAASDAELAMVALGFKQAEARKSIARLLKENPQAGTDELIRGALRLLS
jgi:Holliday junction DNA helicase RuvA